MRLDILDAMQIPTENLFFLTSSFNTKLPRKFDYKCKDWEMYSFEQK